MAVQKIPQYSDISITFQNIQYNVGPTTVDLSSFGDIIFTLSLGHPSNNPILTLKKSTNSSNFTVDNVAKQVTVSIISSAIGTECGRYYANLWLVNGSNNLTHQTVYFDMEPSVIHP